MGKLNINKNVRKVVGFTVRLKLKLPLPSIFKKFIGNIPSFFKRFFILHYWVDENHQLLIGNWQTSLFFILKMKKTVLNFSIELFLLQLLKFETLNSLKYLPHERLLWTSKTRETSLLAWLHCCRIFSSNKGPWQWKVKWLWWIFNWTFENFSASFVSNFVG